MKCGKKSVATRLVELAEKAGIELFHTAKQAAFADLHIEGCRETVPLRGTLFRRWLARLLYEAEDKATGGQALQDAIRVLEAKACFQDEEMEVHVRLAEQDGQTYLDLVDHEWQAVEIIARG